MWQTYFKQDNKIVSIGTLWLRWSFCIWNHANAYQDLLNYLPIHWCRYFHDFCDSWYPLQFRWLQYTALAVAVKARLNNLMWHFTWSKKLLKRFLPILLRWLSSIDKILSPCFISLYSLLIYSFIHISVFFLK